MIGFIIIGTTPIMKAAVGTVKPGVVASSARLENGLNINVILDQGHVRMQNGFPVLASTTTKAVVSELKQETNKDKLLKSFSTFLRSEDSVNFDKNNYKVPFS